MKALIIDGYVDEPACLGVPPYISPQVRAAVGAARSAGAEVLLLTIDDVRASPDLPEADVSMVIGGSAVPGRYLSAMPASAREMEALSSRLSGLKALAGPAALDAERWEERFDALVPHDAAAALRELLETGRMTGRWRTGREWEEWLRAGAIAVTSRSHLATQIAEIETYRGCVRHASGGCSFCVEPLKGPPAFREPEDVIEECRALMGLGARNLRLGAQSCILSYKADLSSGDPPRPDADALETLLSGIASLKPDVLHVDNANPAVIAEWPEESRAAIRSLVRHCAPGNVLAFGMESADPAVKEANNLNSDADQVMSAIAMVNEEGRDIGSNGMPNLLPGLNILMGLDGETRRTPEINMLFLKDVLSRGHLLRRLNIRQVSDVRKRHRSPLDRSAFLRFKERARNEIDRPMLERLVPHGRVLRNVLMELREGNVTYGRQIGAYPLLVGLPYPTEVGRLLDVTVTGHGFRSITAVERPLNVNACSLKALEALPNVGRKRAIRLFRQRPLSSMSDVAEALDDKSASDALDGMIGF